MCLVNAVENVTAWTRVGGELKYERAQQVVTGLFSEVLEVEVKIGHDGGFGFAFGLDVLDNGGTREE